VAVIIQEQLANYAFEIGKAVFFVSLVLIFVFVLWAKRQEEAPVPTGGAGSDGLASAN
jgi:hypothetical protein